MIKYKTKEWYQARIGKFTASSFANLMAKPADKNASWSKSSLNCIEKSALQLYHNEYYERPDCDSTRWGIKYEEQAIKQFSKITGFQNKETGFVLHPQYYDVGATPDVIIIENPNSELNIIAQIKCPFSQNIHKGYIKKIGCVENLKKYKSEYFWQIQGELWVTGADYCYFVTFDPRIIDDTRLHYVKIDRDKEAIINLERQILKSINLRNDMLKDYKEGKKIAMQLKNCW